MSSNSDETSKKVARHRATRDDLKAIEGLSGNDAKIAALEHRISLQARRSDILMKKLAAIHETLVAVQTGGKSVAATDPFASLNPIEAMQFPGSSKTVISFAGMALRNNMPPREFLKSLEKTGSNVMMCKDFRQVWYQQGLLGASTDVVSTVKVLKENMQPDQTHLGTIGSSSGGYAAILFGVLMGAKKILAFGPQTQITKFVFEKFENGQSGFSDVLKNGKGYFDLAQVLKDNVNFTGDIQIHFSADNKIDRKAAESLGDFPSVTLIEHPGTAHGIAAELQKRDQLQPLMDWLAS